jgi:hypothetical protein
MQRTFTHDNAYENAPNPSAPAARANTILVKNRSPELPAFNTSVPVALVAIGPVKTVRIVSFIAGDLDSLLRNTVLLK